MGRGVIKKTELGGLDHCRYIREGRFPENSQVSSVSLLLARFGDTDNA